MLAGQVAGFGDNLGLDNEGGEVAILDAETTPPLSRSTREQRGGVHVGHLAAELGGGNGIDPVPNGARPPWWRQHPSRPPSVL